MSKKSPITTIWEGSGVTNMARVDGWGGPNIVQADIDSAVYWIIAGDGTFVKGSAGSGASLSVSDIISDSLSTYNGRWTKDSTGGNFLHHVSGANVPDGATTYRMEYELTPSASAHSMSPIYLVFRVETGELKGPS